MGLFKKPEFHRVRVSTRPSTYTVPFLPPPGGPRHSSSSNPLLPQHRPGAARSPAMGGDGSEPRRSLSLFLESGVYRLEGSGAVFVDPVRVLNRSLARFSISPSDYYPRFFEPGPAEAARGGADGRKRKRRAKKPLVLNERERVAAQRHQEARPFLVKAHESLLGATELRAFMLKMKGEVAAAEDRKSMLPGVPPSFIELGRLWQAPLYEITLNFSQEKPTGDGGPLIVHSKEQKVIPIFDNLVHNGTEDDLEAEFLGSQYVIPRESCFYMSDLQQIHKMVPVEGDARFHFIVIDPPWENGSAQQKLRYPTLPNKYFLSLPVQQLAHREGALVALWVTNREKLRNFVEKELFPAWGVKYLATFYWLKVKSDGSMICDLDLFHHRPYECILLGFCDKESWFSSTFQGPSQHDVLNYLLET
ncbi:hypothetical protein BT93_F0394 [Corymbia citriodora subsp. variegata]|nr:hypothetical protein BT93_F0394 [Corymbia citriodora subsp. variegata]KAF8022862.1 hypothetical protein BT93_F0394 [Corymbia citriodora subsp. variegata]